jgi:hypothetical protein
MNLLSEETDFYSIIQPELWKNNDELNIYTSGEFAIKYASLKLVNKRNMRISVSKQ